MLHIIIPIVTFIVGLIAGAIATSFYVKKKMNSMMSMDPNQIATLAKSMGMNLNQKQLNQASRMMQNKQNKGTKKKK